jgi:hypothetical protein
MFSPEKLVQIVREGPQRFIGPSLGMSHDLGAHAEQRLEPGCRVRLGRDRATGVRAVVFGKTEGSRTSIVRSLATLPSWVTLLTSSVSGAAASAGALVVGELPYSRTVMTPKLSANRRP